MNRNLKENHDFAKHQLEIAEKKETMKLTKQSAVEMNSPKLEFKSSEACNNKILVLTVPSNSFICGSRFNTSLVSAMHTSNFNLNFITCTVKTSATQF